MIDGELGDRPVRPIRTFPPFGAIARIHTREAELTAEQQARLNDFVDRYTKRTARSKAYTAEHRPHMADPRVVNGFLQGTYNDVSGNYTVRASDAHTWVEVFFTQYGWITFDPTPLVGRTEQAALFGRLGMYMDAFQSLWEEWIINYDFLHQIILARELRGNTREIRRDSQATFRKYYQSLVSFVAHATDWVLARRVGVTIVLAIAVGAMWLLLLRSSLARWLPFRSA